MTKEIYHQGWLIKSPPTKRIWRARWRKRWFTLKQGEIPEQFCLEYYKDHNCRKLKGVIDLDQCEQVDSGLQLEHRKQKFQYMFDVKTPLRTYYLAANSEEDMNAWVNCICEVCNLQDLSKPQQRNTADGRQYYNVTPETSNDQQAAANPSLVVALKSNALSPVKSSSNASDQVALLPTAEPIDNNNSVYQNYDAMCLNSNYNNRETLICDVPLNKNASNDGREPKEDYYNFTAIASVQSSNDSGVLKNNRNSMTTSDAPSFGERRVIVSQSVHRKIPENLKLNSGIVADVAPPQSSTQSGLISGSTGPYIAISDCISGNPLIDRDNPTTPLNSLDPKFYDTPRSHFNIGLNLTNEQPYSPKRNNIQTLPSQAPPSGKSSPTDSESVFTDEEEYVPTNSYDTINGERCMRPSESSVENDSIIFTYAQRFSKMPESDDSVVTKRKMHTKKPLPVAGLSLEKNDSEEQNKDINSSDTENASPAIAYGPKDHNSYVEESYDIPRSHQLPYTKNHDGNISNSEETMDLRVSDASSSIRELDEDRASQKTPSNISQSEFSAAIIPKRRHFYTNAAPAKVEGNVFRYDFDDKHLDAPAVDRKLKPKLHHDELKPPCIDRKLKPTTPIKLETSTLQRRGNFMVSTDAEFQGYNSDQISKTLPRNYNNSASQLSSLTIAPSLLTATTTTTIASATPSTAAQPAAAAAVATTSSASTARQAGVLEYFDLDHSNPPPICNNSMTSAITSNLNAQASGSAWPVNNLSHRLSAVSISSSTIFGNQSATGDLASGINSAAINSTNSGSASGGIVSNPPTASGIVYKSVDFIKTEAFMRTRQDAELARAKNRSKE